MKKLALLFMVMASLLFAGSAVAFADHQPNHDPGGVNDPGSGCNDQPNGPSCVPDPSEEGQDCLPHGNNEDGNENHCSPTSTVTVPPSPTTPPPTETEPPPTTTVTTPPPTETTPPPTETTSPPPSPSEPPTTTVTPPATQPPAGPTNGPSEPPRKLAFTGPEDWTLPLGALAALMLLTGLGLLRAGHKRSENE